MPNNSIPIDKERGKKVKEITEKLLNNEQFKLYIKEAQNKTDPIYLLGLTDISKSYIIGTTLKLIKTPICIVTYNELQAKELFKYCKYFMHIYRYTCKHRFRFQSCF